jgi:membrane protease YdiL (CAAX protease family)
MSGDKDLASRCLRWRVGLRWYAAAILVPVGIALAAVALNVLLGAPMPSADRLGPWYRPLLLLPEVLFDAPLGEEAGWRGYALPLFPAGNSALASSLVLGVLIAGWHLPIALDAPALAPYLLGTVASAILANWVYYNARASALLVILYHTVQNAIGGWYLFRLFAGDDLVRLWWLWAGLYCVGAVCVVILAGPPLARGSTLRPEPTR